MDDQWLDLMEIADAADRLDHEPTVIGDVALYGIDAVRKPAWSTTDFTLTPPEGDLTTILCMHQLLTPPVPEIQAEHETAEVLDRVNINLDGLALGDYHEAESVAIDDTKIWYAGSTERCSTSEEDPRTVSLIEIEGEDLRRRQIELDTRAFEPITIEFGEDDSFSHVESVVGQHDIVDKVVPVHLVGERTSVTSRDVRRTIRDRGAAVCRVKDDRGREEIEIGDGPTGEVDDPETVIESHLSDAELSSFTLDLEETIRRTATKSGFDDEIEQRVTEQQATVFDSDDDSGSADPEGDQ
jgi:DNA repair exonuclease SbcCD nuclease subunit